MSAGDIAWGGVRPRPEQTLVALSVSGATGATVKAAKLAKSAGAKVVAVTAGATSPLARTADHLITIPSPPACDSVPAGGFLSMGLAIAGLLGAATADTPATLSGQLDELVAELAEDRITPPAMLPAAISVLSLPELAAARRFWTLKVIEAVGIAARSVPLEEWGHVDYFLGPQPHLDIVLLGAHGRERAAELGATMLRVGHDQRVFDVASLGTDLPESNTIREILVNLVVGAKGAIFADECARVWGRTPFRGGAIDMSASHIQSPNVAAS
jgi:hypothetical protein